MNKRRRLTGVVTSNKMDKTVVVQVKRTFRHKVYAKVIHSVKKVMAHDEMGCEIGDHVIIVESMPISRHKHWVVEQILRRDIAAADTEGIVLEPEVAEVIEPEVAEVIEPEGAEIDETDVVDVVEPEEAETEESEEVEAVEPEGEA
jgi:small subunit ribosomal protein S17